MSDSDRSTPLRSRALFLKKSHHRLTHRFADEPVIDTVFDVHSLKTLHNQPA